MANLIVERVELARRGQNPFVICKMRSGWLVIGDVQPPALHAHIVPRYRIEPDAKRRRPAWVGYDWPTSRRFDPAQDGMFVERMRQRLTSVAV